MMQDGEQKIIYDKQKKTVVIKNMPLSFHFILLCDAESFDVLVFAEKIHLFFIVYFPLKP